MSGAVEEVSDWPTAFRKFSAWRTYGRVREYFSQDDDTPPPTLLDLRWLQTLITVANLHARRIGLVGRTRFERVAEALGILSDWTERFDRILWPHDDANASYLFGLSELYANHQSSASAAGIFYVTRQTYECPDEALNEIVGESGRVRITIHVFQVVDAADGSALTHTVSSSVYARTSRQQLGFTIDPTPFQFTSGVYEDLNPAEASYALRAQIKSLLLGAPSSQREASRLDNADDAIADAIERAVRRGAFFVAAFNTPIGVPAVPQSVFAFLNRVAQMRDMLLFQLDPRYADVRPDPNERRDFRLDLTADELATQFQRRFTNFTLPGTDAWKLYMLGWPLTTSLANLRTNLRSELERMYEVFYERFVSDRFEDGFIVYSENVEEDNERQEANARVYDPLFYSDEEGSN